MQRNTLFNLCMSFLCRDIRKIPWVCWTCSLVNGSYLHLASFCSLINCSITFEPLKMGNCMLQKRLSFLSLHLLNQSWKYAHKLHLYCLIRNNLWWCIKKKCNCHKLDLALNTIGPKELLQYRKIKMYFWRHEKIISKEILDHSYFSLLVCKKKTNVIKISCSTPSLCFWRDWGEETSPQSLHVFFEMRTETVGCGDAPESSIENVFAALGVGQPKMLKHFLLWWDVKWMCHASWK